MDFDEWFNGLSPDQKAAYAAEAGTTVGYIRVHLIRASKIPGVDLMEKLVAASHGIFTLSGLAAWFYRKAADRNAKKRIANLGGAIDGQRAA